MHRGIMTRKIVARRHRGDRRTEDNDGGHGRAGYAYLPELSVSSRWRAGVAPELKSPDRTNLCAPTGNRCGVSPFLSSCGRSGGARRRTHRYRRLRTWPVLTKTRHESRAPAMVVELSSPGNENPAMVRHGLPPMSTLHGLARTIRRGRPRPAMGVEFSSTTNYDLRRSRSARAAESRSLTAQVVNPAIPPPPYPSRPITS
jgi:hypothetical protein